MKKLFALVLIALFNFQFSKAYAQTPSCQPIYGGGQSCITTSNITINKTVLNPQTNQFVDSLSINDPKYQPGWIPTFQISITNSGNSNISKIDVKDILPQYISFGSGNGTFDSSTNTLSFSLTDLAPNETRKYGILGRIFNANQIPISSGSEVCVVNQAIAMVNGKNVSQDNAQFCIEKIAENALFPTPALAAVTTNVKGGFPVFSPAPTVSSPATGPESLTLLALIPIGIVGLFLIRKSRTH